MRFTLSTVLVALAVLSEASATMMSPRPQHANLARRITRKKRCIARHGSGNNPIANVASSPSSSSAAPPPPAAQTPNNQNNGNNNNNNNHNNNPPPPSNNNNNNYNGGGITTAPPNECGFGAVPYPTQDSGPNGNIEYLNCGVRGGGWNPPQITLQNVVCKPFDEVVNMPGNPFGGCSQYAWMFIAASQETGVPSTLLASIAMQESSCQPWVTGRAGEVGMMQLTGEKCPDGYPNERCYDAQTNIAIGARYLRSEIDRAGGNLLLATGFYNGWFQGLTIDAANNKPSCGQRNNLDYLQFVFNGYCQGVDPSSLGMGTFRNVC